MRLCAKSREAVSSSVDFLTLHHLVNQLAMQSKSELYKLGLLKEMQGELSTKDERRFKTLKRNAERAILQVLFSVSSVKSLASFVYATQHSSFHFQCFHSSLSLHSLSLSCGPLSKKNVLLLLAV